jgi:hypothetical protein
MKNSSKALLIGAVCVIFFVGLMQRIQVPLLLSGEGSVGHPTIKEAHSHENEVKARQDDVQQTLLQLVRDGVLSCAQRDQTAFATIERIVEQQHAKEREEAQRKDAAETRKQYFQIVLTSVLTPAAVIMFFYVPKLRTIAAAIITAVLAFWLKA